MGTPYLVEVLVREDDNMAGYSWGFSIWVALRKTGRYSVGASYYANEPPTPRFRRHYPLKSGREVWEAIEQLYSAMGENEPPLEIEDAKSIAQRLAQLDPEMASEVLVAAIAAFVLDVENEVVSSVSEVPTPQCAGKTTTGEAVSPEPPFSSSSLRVAAGTPATHTPEELALLDVMRRLEGDEFVDRHEAGILSQAYRIGEL